jgi:hypothetical protein
MGGSSLQGIAMLFAHVNGTDFALTSIPTSVDFTGITKWIPVNTAAINTTITLNTNRRLQFDGHSYDYPQFMYPNYVKPLIPLSGEGVVRVTLDAVNAAGVGVVSGLQYVSGHITWKSMVWLTISGNLELWLANTSNGGYISNGLINNATKVRSKTGLTNWDPTAINSLSLLLMCSKGASYGLRVAVAVNSRFSGQTEMYVDDYLNFSAEGFYPFIVTQSNNTTELNSLMVTRK